MRPKKSNREKPEIYAVNQSKDSDGLKRREFLGLLGGGAALALTPMAGSAMTVPQAKDHMPGKLPGDLCSYAKAHEQPVNSVAFSADGAWLASGAGENYSSGELKLWRMPGGELIKTLEGHSSEVNSVAFSPDGSLLASCGGSYSGELKLWHLPDGELLKTLGGNSDKLSSVAFSPDGTLLASCGGSYSGELKLWHLPDGELQKTMGGNSVKFNSVAFSPDGILLACGSFGKIKLWRMPDGKLLKTLGGHTDTVNSVTFSPDGKLLYSGSSDNSVRVWKIDYVEKEGNDTKNKTDLTKFVLPLWGVSQLNKQPGEKELSEENSAKSDNSGIITGAALIAGAAAVSLLQSCSGLKAECINTIENADYKPVYSVAVNCEGNIMASGCSDGAIKLWRMPEGELLKTLDAQNGSVNTVAFSPDGSLLASVSADNIRFWRMPEGEPDGCLVDPVLIEPVNAREIRQFDPKTICTCNTVLVSPGTSLSGRTVCTCDIISVGTKNTENSNVKRVARKKGSTCTCNTICTCNTVSSNVKNTSRMSGSICTCNTVCTCDTVCSCVSVRSSSCGGHYWHPC